MRAGILTQPSLDPCTQLGIWELCWPGGVAAATRTALLQLEMPLAMHAFTGILADMGLCTETLPVVSMMDSNCDAVTQSDNPTPAEVDRVHALLVESLSRMYAEHRHLVPGWETRPLHII